MPCYKHKFIGKRRRLLGLIWLDSTFKTYEQDKINFAKKIADLRKIPIEEIKIINTFNF